MMINVRFCLGKNSDRIKGCIYINNHKIIKDIRYISYQQQKEKRITLFFTDNTSIEIADTSDIYYEK